MAVLPSDIVFYKAAVSPKNDATTGVGGEIDTTKVPLFIDQSSALDGAVSVVSDNAADNQIFVLQGRKASGQFITSEKALNGTTPVNFDDTVAYIYSVGPKTTASAGAVTVKNAGGTTVAVLGSGQTVERIFWNASAPVSGSVSIYEKVFIKNTGAGTVEAASILEFADPSSLITFGVESVINGNDSTGANNRYTAPAGVTFDGTEKVVPGTNNELGAGDCIGVWLKLTMGPNQYGTASSYQLQIKGNAV